MRSDAQVNNFSQNFEMAAIFTLADHFMHYGKTEFYDLAEWLFKIWHQSEKEGIADAIKKLIFPFKKKFVILKSRAFYSLLLKTKREPTIKKTLQKFKELKENLYPLTSRKTPPPSKPPWREEEDQKVKSQPRLRKRENSCPSPVLKVKSQ